MKLEDMDHDEGRFTVEQYRGVAFYSHGEQTEPDEDTEWSGIENPTGKVVMTMVGDDHKYLVDPEDIEPLDELAYCAECGQIGCTHDGRERE